MKQYRGAIPRSEMRLRPSTLTADRIRDEITMARDVPFATIIETELGKMYGGSVLGRSWKNLSKDYLSRKAQVVAAYEFSPERIEASAAPFRLGGFLAIHTYIAEQPRGTKQGVLAEPIMRERVLRTFSAATDEQSLTNFDVMLERVHGRLPDDVRTAVYVAGSRAARVDLDEHANQHYIREFGHGFSLAATNMIRLIARHVDTQYIPRELSA